ncbi:MAG: N-acetyltransferase [Firmicutes bacterium]|nr:N-acetyltransferase [Bacillota bacterium]MBQ6842343.1 N-acetyltransferase [Bacillota bacterium]
MIIRVADPDRDAAAICDIYAPYVRETAITFAYEPPTVAEEAALIRHLQQRYPYLVAEDEQGRVIGYAYACQFKDEGRAAFTWSVEVSVYVAKDVRRSGAGRALYTALERCLKAQGVVVMYASIATAEAGDPYLTNDSELFHQKMGFVKCAHFAACGNKFGRWYDLIWMEKRLHDTAAVADLRPFTPQMLAEALQV